MNNINCVISSAATKRNLKVLTRCIQSLLSAKINNIKLTVIVTTTNQSPVLGNLKENIDKLMQTSSKLGFVGMNNNAIEKTISDFSSSYYLFINDDAWVQSNFFVVFSRMIRLSKPDVLVPLIYEGDGPVLDSFGVEYFTSGYSKNALSTRIRTTLASWSCVLVKTTFLQKMKSAYGFYLNPLLVWYLDDVDFSIRALAIGGEIRKNVNLIVHHLRTFTWGRLSYTVMYHTYRNLLWIIFMTWPLHIILRFLPTIILIQGWNLTWSVSHFGPGVYIKIVLDTIKNFMILSVYRKKILAVYETGFDFTSVMSKYSYRVGKNFWGYGIRSWLGRYI